jgi:DNA polymerase elongation subunit (family B)
MIIFDIETGAVPNTELAKLFKFDITAVRGYDLLNKNFDPSEVKTGNIKDPVKVQEKIDAAREKFENEKTGAKALIETSEQTAWDNYKRQAALSPLTGQVLAIGYYDSLIQNGYFIDFIGNKNYNSDKFIQQNTDTLENERSEYALISDALSVFDTVISDGKKVIGHNIIGFDLPFLLRRAIRYGIKIPKSILVQLNQYKPNLIIDTMRLWQLGNRTEKFVGLDDLAAYFQTIRKNGDGANFATLFNGSPEQRLEAINYLRNDVIMTKQIYEKLEGLNV